MYHDPEILFLDEATSALDALTEKNIIENLMKIKNKTIIIISHRLSSLSKCDYIYEVINKKITKVEKN